jgi:hypothetical protein
VEILVKVAPAPTYALDELASAQGHEILRTPPYHPEQRFDAIGAYRQADVLEPKGFGRCKLDLHIAALRADL